MQTGTRHQRLIVVIVCGMTIMGLLGLGGCHDHDRSNPTIPTEPTAVPSQNCGNFFCYTASQTDGITITADFTRYHRVGQPFGTWFVEVEWRSADRQFAQELTAPVVIDGAGQGVAHVSPDFLQAIFAQANSDSSLWDKQPGLTIGFYPDDETWEYYQFD